MAIYNKSLQDYFRIPVIIKPLTPLSSKISQKIRQIFYYKYFNFPIDERYIRKDSIPHIEILDNRQQISQRLLFIPEDFTNDWPEFQVIYKAKFSIGIIDDALQQHQLEQLLGRMNNQNGFRLIGIINFSKVTYQNLFKRQNIIKCGQMSQQQFIHFIDPWLYNCLSIIESELCCLISQIKKDDDYNKTIVFNRMEEKFQQKTNKKRKKYRCIKLCGDYYLMLHLYREAFNYYNQAEENLKKLDDFTWILGCLQGKLAILTTYERLQLQDKEQYIQELIAQTYAVAKKAKIWSFQCENYFKIIRLYVNQPQKTDQLIKSFLINNVRLTLDDEVFLLFTTLGSIYEKCGLHRKKNYCYFVSSTIYASKSSHLNTVLLSQIRKSPSIKQWPSLYKSILQQQINENEEKEKNNELYIQLLSKCGNYLTEKQIHNIMNSLNFTNNDFMHMKLNQFIQLKEFYVVPSPVKPKQNRIGNRKSPTKAQPNFFMSWRKEQSLLFEQSQEIVLKFIFANKIPLPIRIKMTIEIRSQRQPSRLCSSQQIYIYLQPNVLNKFQRVIQAKGQHQQIWMIDKINIIAWNFIQQISIHKPIKYETYQKQPQIYLDIKQELHFQQTCNLTFSTSLTRAKNIPFCLIKLNFSIYYTIDVGFQQNEVILNEQNNYLGVDFERINNIMVLQSQDGNSTQIKPKQGMLMVRLKRFKAHRRFINRIQINLQYLRSLQSKYQTTKQYKCKCIFYTQFTYQIAEISTPIIGKIYKNTFSNLKIIQTHYNYKLKIIKNIQNNKKYTIRYQQKQYKFINDVMIIEEIKEKIKYDEEDKQLKSVIYWQEDNSDINGQIQVIIPFSSLMRQSEKNVKFSVISIQNDKYQKIKVSYQIFSDKKTNLSHSVVLNPVQIEIDRMYVVRGKNKIQQQGINLKNEVELIFSTKCCNSYQIGLLFNDGWIFWYEDLIKIYQP